MTLVFTVSKFKSLFSSTRVHFSNSFYMILHIKLHNTSSKTAQILSLNQLWETSLFTKRERSLIFSSLKKSSFLKSMILLNFPIQWYLSILNLFNISMILNKWIILWFSLDVTTRSQLFVFLSTQHYGFPQGQNLKKLFSQI